MKKDIIRVKVISDIHFGCKDDKQLWVELQEEFIPTIDATLDLLVIAGDLFHRILKLNEPGSYYAFKLIDQLFELAEIYDFVIRIVKGTKSHDFNQLNNFKTYEKSDRFGIAETITIEELFGISILYIPEEYVENPEEYYTDYFNSKYDLVFFHGTMDFAGFTSHLKSTNAKAKMAPTFKSSQIADLAYGPIVGGHIHIPMNYKEKIFYTGSFSRFNFGEPEDKGFVDYVYYPDKKDFSINYVKNNMAPEFVTVKLSDLNGNLEEKIQKIEMLKEEYHNLRIDVSEKEKNENQGVVDAIKRLTDEKVKIKVANSFEEQYDSKYDFILNKKFPLNQTIQKFIKMTKGKDIDLSNIDLALKKED